MANLKNVFVTRATRYSRHLYAVRAYPFHVGCLLYLEVINRHPAKKGLVRRVLKPALNCGDVPSLSHCSDLHWWGEAFFRNATVDLSR